MKYFKNYYGVETIKISKIIFGAWPFANDGMWGKHDIHTLQNTVDAAIDNGINAFDTAEGYGTGMSERVLGKCINGKRSKVLIMTKTNGPTFSKKELIETCNRSLKRLNTDYIDIYQLHWRRPKMVSSDEISEAAECLAKQGKIRFFSVCNFGAKQLEELRKSIEIPFNQLPYNMLWRTTEDFLIPLNNSLSIRTLAYSPLFHGLLTGKYSSLEEFPKSRRQSLLFSAKTNNAAIHGMNGYEEEVDLIVRKLYERFSSNLLRIAIAFVLKKTHAAIVGATKPEHIEKIVASLDYDIDSVYGEIRELTNPLKEKLKNYVDMWMVPSRIY